MKTEETYRTEANVRQFYNNYLSNYFAESKLELEINKIDTVLLSEEDYGKLICFIEYKLNANLANFNEYIKTLGQLCHYCNNNLRTQAFDSPSVVVAADEKYFVPMPYSLIRSYVHIDRYYEGYSASEVYKNEEFMNDLKEDVAIKEFFDEHILYIRREEVPSFKRIQNKINSIARKELMPY